MMLKRWIVCMLALCVVAGASFAISTAIYSRQVAAEAQSAAGQGMSLVTGYLQLTPEQERHVDPINKAFRAEQRAACAQMQEARAMLLSVLKQPQPKQEDINTALADLAKIQAECQRSSAQYLLELKSVLTDDQQKQLFELVGQRFCEQGKCGAGMCPGVGKSGRNERPKSMQ